MATTLYFRGGTGNADDASPNIHTGTNHTALNGAAEGWIPLALHTTRGEAGAAVSYTATTVTGPTNGIEIKTSAVLVHWISLPLDAGVTISGTITLNLWAFETNMSANVAINAVIERLDSTGAVISTIAQTARTTEVALNTPGVNNFTVTPTSTNMLKGDRIRVRVYGDDAGTMASSFAYNFNFGRSSASVDGDSWVRFNEDFGLQTSDPAGSTLYLTDVAGPAVGANIEKEMWTSRGDGVNSVVRNTAAGWTSPLQWTDSGGGTAVEWYSKPLTAFTLSGLVKVNLRAAASNATTCGIRAELAVCDSDGSNATTWGAATIVDAATVGGATTDPNGALGTSEAAVRGYLSGDDLAVTDGRRLRLRVFVDDMGQLPCVTGRTATLWYDGTSGGASGDSFITLPQSVTEYAPRGPEPQVRPSPAVHRSYSW